MSGPPGDLSKAREVQPDGVISEPQSRAAVDPAVFLTYWVPALWRAMRRGVRTAGNLSTNESEIAVLRLLDLHGPLQPTQLADLLHLARPTISNLLRQLTARRLVERHGDETGDGRSALVTPTASGRRLLEAFRTDRTDLVRAALLGLSPEDQATIRGATSALRHLLHEFELVGDKRARAVTPGVRRGRLTT